MNQINAKTMSAALLFALGLIGCAVGPNFKSPTPPAATGYTRQPLPEQTEATDVAGGEAQRFQFGRDLPGEWWKLFSSDKLDALINDAMAHNPDIAAQQATLRAARESVRAEQGVFLPQFQGTGNVIREKSSGASVGPGFPGFIASFYTANVQVSYAFDVFGGERRALESAQAQAGAQLFELEASYLTLTSTVASTVIKIAELRDQITATNEIIAVDSRQLDFIQRQFQLGSQTRAAVLAQQAAVAAVRAMLPGLQQQLEVAQHQLAVLTGHAAQDAAAVELTLSDLKLPQDLPVSLPSALVAQRPDIKLQEMVMHQQSAAVGIATANLLPQITLTGLYGGDSLRLASLLTPAGRYWNLEGGIVQPLFKGGALRAERRAAIDNLDAASATYQRVVLQALQGVADSLTALDHDAEALKAEYDALQAARAALDFTQRQFDDGAVDYVSLFTQQQAYQQARIAFIEAQASRYADTVALFQALGGGWWQRSDAGTLPLPPSARAAR